MKTSHSTSPSEPRDPWAAPEGRFKATVSNVRIDGEKGKVRVVFRIPEQAGTDDEYLAGKTYTSKQYGYLTRDLETWLGRDELEKLFPDDFVELEKLKRLKGRCAVIDVEHIEEEGYSKPFRDITSIRPCRSSDDSDEYASPGRGPGFKLSDFEKKSNWN